MDDIFAAIEDYWPAGRDDDRWYVLPGSGLLRDRISRPYEEVIRQPGLVLIKPADMRITAARRSS